MLCSLWRKSSDESIAVAVLYGLYVFYRLKSSIWSALWVIESAGILQTSIGNSIRSKCVFTHPLRLVEGMPT